MSPALLNKLYTHVSRGELEDRRSLRDSAFRLALLSTDPTD